MENLQKLLAAGILIVAAISAHAVPSLIGSVTCTGDPPNEVCLQQVTCEGAAAPFCISVSIITENDASCGSITLNDQNFLQAEHANLGPNPQCEFVVTDTSDNATISTSITAEDGLPVKLQSFSIK